MNLTKLTLIGTIALTLTACQMAPEGDVSTDAAQAIVGKCDDPQADRDTFLAKQLLVEDKEASLATVREAYVSRGGDPEESGSFNAFREMLTGEPSKMSAQTNANYMACIKAAAA